MSKADSKELSPGKVLQALREERNLTLDDIFERTRISIKKLALIEKDSYSQFEAPVFVRGYIRSYARAVGGDGNNLIRLYDQLFVESDEIPLADQISDSGFSESSQRFVSSFSKNFINKTSIWSVVAVLACLWLVTILIFGGGSDPEPGYTSVDQNVSGDTVMLASANEGATKVADAPLNDAQAKESDKSLGVEEREVLAVSQAVQISPESALSNESLGQPEPVSDAFSTKIEEAAVESFLGFQFSDECWVEVRDAFDKRIFADTKNKGDNLRLSGVAPFDIMLGNARATELTVDGEPVELRVSGNRKTLRLTVFAK